MIQFGGSMGDTISSKIASSFLDTSSKADSVVADVYKEKGDSVLNNAFSKFGKKTDGMSTAILNSNWISKVSPRR